nr:probable WRKY transcription factor protein 1 isoform X2 [Dermatophagoides farinae]
MANNNKTNWDDIWDKIVNLHRTTEQPRRAFISDDSFSVSSLDFSNIDIDESDENCSKSLSNKLQSPSIESCNSSYNDKIFCSTSQKTTLANYSLHKLSNITILAAKNESYNKQQPSHKSLSLSENIKTNSPNDAGQTVHNSTKRKHDDIFNSEFSKKPRPSNIPFDETKTTMNKELTDLILKNMDSPYNSPCTPNVIRNLDKQASFFCMTKTFYQTNTFYRSRTEIEACRRNDSQVINSIPLFNDDIQKIYEDTRELSSGVVLIEKNQPPKTLVTEIVSIHGDNDDEQDGNYIVDLIEELHKDKSISEKSTENEIQPEGKGNHSEMEQSIDEFILENNATDGFESINDEQMDKMDNFEEPEVSVHGKENEPSIISEHELYAEMNNKNDFQPELSPPENQLIIKKTQKECLLNQTFDISNKSAKEKPSEKSSSSTVNGNSPVQKKLSLSKKKMNLLVPYDLNSTEEDISFGNSLHKIVHCPSIDSHSNNIDDDVSQDIYDSNVDKNEIGHLQDVALSPIHFDNDSDVEFNELMDCHYDDRIDDEHEKMPSNHFFANLSSDNEQENQYHEDNVSSSPKRSDYINRIEDSSSPELIIRRHKKQKQKNYFDRMLKIVTNNDNIAPVNYENNLRRSQRNRIKPLDYWRGQRPIYKMEQKQINDQVVTMPTIVGIAKPCQPVIKRRRFNKKTNKRNINNNADDNGNNNEHQCYETQTSSNARTKLQDILNLSVQSKKIPQKSLINCPEFVKNIPSLNFKPSEKSKGIHTALIEKDDRGRAFGMMRFESFASKKKGRNGSYTTYFMVIYGAFILKVDDEDDVLIKSGSYFKILPKSEYSIKNVRNDESLIHFLVTQEQSSN